MQKSESELEELMPFNNTIIFTHLQYYHHEIVSLSIFFSYDWVGSALVQRDIPEFDYKHPHKNDGLTKEHFCQLLYFQSFLNISLKKHFVLLQLVLTNN